MLTGPKSWLPTTSQAHRVRRAQLWAQIRQFFADRGVLEVQTQSLSQHTVTDVHIESFQIMPSRATQKPYYLQTSPEYAMKRLLAAGSGPIYQLGKAFRIDESGTQHNPEFTLLEWYRPGFTHHQLMDEVDELLQEILAVPPARRMTYAGLFMEHWQISPFTAPLGDLQQLAAHHGLANAQQYDDRDTLLNFLLALITDVDTGENHPLFVFDFPASQAALARLSPDNPQVGERFEVYLRGIELANGFHELCDPQEQRRRFMQDQQKRKARGAPSIEIDERFIAALSAGLPACAGVALGVDRLLMLQLGARSIAEVIDFPWEIA